MKKEIRSILWSLSIVLLYLYATKGLVRLFWNTTDEYKFVGRVKFIIYLHLLLIPFVVIAPYHLLGPAQVAGVYWVIIIYLIAYVLIGAMYNLFSKAD